jgi:predicted metalloprotease
MLTVQEGGTWSLERATVFVAVTVSNVIDLLWVLQAQSSRTLAKVYISLLYINHKIKCKNTVILGKEQISRGKIVILHPKCCIWLIVYGLQFTVYGLQFTVYR